MPVKKRKWYIRSLAILAFCYSTLAISTMFFEEKLIYFPTKYPIGNWSPVDIQYEDAFFEAEDGTKLHGWFFEHENPQGHLLYCHGNADFVANLGQLGNEWRAQYRINVLVFDYRGYGRSEGSPNEQGVIADARAARKWLSERVNSDQRDVILAGRSLGGGVVSAIAADGPARGIILQSTFSSLTDTAAVHYPFLPVRWLMRNRFESIKHLKQYEGSLLQSHGTADEIVPYKLGQRLFDVIPSNDKQFYSCEGMGHNEFEPEDYHQELGEFIQRICEKQL